MLEGALDRGVAAPSLCLAPSASLLRAGVLTPPKTQWTKGLKGSTLETRTHLHVDKVGRRLLEDT